VRLLSSVPLARCLSWTVLLLISGNIEVHPQNLLNRTGGRTLMAAPETSGLFLTDSFQPGSDGETWVIERIRMWGQPEASEPSRTPGDVLESITLRGGLWSDPPGPGTPDCGCHGLVPLASASLEPGTTRTGNSAITVTRDRPSDTWQIEFNRLMWSVPGGSRVQLGLQVKSRSRITRTWRPLAAASSDTNTWHLFTADGQPASDFRAGAGHRMDLQIWAHRLASVAIARQGSNYEVVIKGQPKFDVKQIDAATLQLSPGGARPDFVRIIDFDGDGIPDLSGVFSVSRAIIPSGTVTACVRGTLGSGDAFEGCDLMPPQPAR
jgi:hypothetical protein